MKHIGWMAARFVCLGIGSVLLYYGVGFLLFVPGVPGESYWQKERLTYGVLPLLFSVITALLSTWLAIQTPQPSNSDHLSPEPDPVLTLGKSLAYTGVGAVVVFLLLIVKGLFFR